MVRLPVSIINQNIIYYDSRRQKIPCKTRSEPQGSNKRGVRKKKARQERVFKTYGKSGQKSSEYYRVFPSTSHILAKKILCGLSAQKPC